MGYTLTTVAAGKAPVGTATASLVVPDVSVTVVGALAVTPPDTGVPYEEAAIPAGGGALVVAGGVPPPLDATLAVTESAIDVAAR
jgi:hypothetical protein